MVFAQFLLFLLLSMCFKLLKFSNIPDSNELKAFELFPAGKIKNRKYCSSQRLFSFCDINIYASKNRQIRSIM